MLPRSLLLLSFFFVYACESSPGSGIRRADLDAEISMDADLIRRDATSDAQVQRESGAQDSSTPSGDASPNLPDSSTDASNVSCTHEGETFAPGDQRFDACMEDLGTSAERGMATRYTCTNDGEWRSDGLRDAPGSCSVSDIRGNSYRICDGESVLVCGGEGCRVSCNDGVPASS